MRKRPARRERKSVGAKAADKQQGERYHREQNEQRADTRGEELWCAQRTIDRR